MAKQACSRLEALARIRRSARHGHRSFTTVGSTAAIAHARLVQARFNGGGSAIPPRFSTSRPFPSPTRRPPTARRGVCTARGGAELQSVSGWPSEESAVRPRRPLASLHCAPPHTGTGTAVLFPQSSPPGWETRGIYPGAAEGGAAWRSRWCCSSAAWTHGRSAARRRCARPAAGRAAHGSSSTGLREVGAGAGARGREGSARLAALQVG